MFDLPFIIVYQIACKTHAIFLNVSTFQKEEKCRGNNKRYLEVYFYSHKQLYGQEIPHPLVLRPHIEVHRKYWVSYTNGNIIYKIKLYWKWLAFINISCVQLRCVKMFMYIYEILFFYLNENFYIAYIMKYVALFFHTEKFPPFYLYFEDLKMYCTLSNQILDMSNVLHFLCVYNLYIQHTDDKNDCYFPILV